jgi:hypothetical protein
MFCQNFFIGDNFWCNIIDFLSNCTHCKTIANFLNRSTTFILLVWCNR